MASEIEQKFPLTSTDVNALREPKLDIIVYCVSLEESDGYDEFDIPFSENKLILPVTKLWPLTSSDDTVTCMVVTGEYSYLN